MTVRGILLTSVVVVSATGCAPRRTDYRAFLDYMPRSILVLPPLNDSTEVKASDAFLSTITFPLAEAGYYVYPMAVVDQMFKENGVPTPGEMHSVSLEKINEVFEPDAVLYIRIKTWTTTYVVIDSTTMVVLEYRLVDTKTGILLWSYTGAVKYSSSQGQSNIISMAVAAQIHAAMSLSGAYERNCARRVNWMVCADRQHGLLIGARHPQFERDQLRIRKLQAKLDEKFGRTSVAPDS